MKFPALPTHTMSTGDVMRAVGCSHSTVYAYEDELQPIRLPNGQRRYDPAIVKRVFEQRARIRNAG